MRSFSTLTATALVGVLVVSAGCLGVLAGEEPLAFEAEPIAVADDATAEAGYELSSNQSVVVERNVSVQGQERSVEITNHVAVYHRSIQGVDAAFFVAFSTPEAAVVGQSLNPLGGLPRDELLKRVVTQESDVSDVEQTGSFELDVLDESRTVDSYSGTMTRNGQPVDLTLHLVRFSHEGDLVIAIGAYPRDYSGEDGIRAMLGGIEHPA